MVALLVRVILLIVVCAVFNFSSIDCLQSRTTVKVGKNSISVCMSSTDDNWCKSYDDSIKVIKEIKMSTINGLRGVFATDRIDPSTQKTPIVTVTADLALEVTNNRPPTPVPDICPQSLWENSLWDQRLAYKLLYELHVKGSASKSIDWLKQLPARYSTPLHWDSQRVTDTHYSSLDKKVKKQSSDWKALYGTWKTSGVSADIVNKISYDQFIYALETINSRAFSGVYEGSSASERQALLVFTGLLTLLWPILGLGTEEQAISAAFAVGLSILARDVFFSRISGLKRYVVCPYIDMFNHKSSSNTDVSYNYFSNQFELVSKEVYEQGDQVYISYGKQSNDRLLQYYGFIESECIYDLYDFGSNAVEVVLGYGDEIAAIAPFPSSPKPSDRLKIIATALSTTQIEDSNKKGKAISVNGGPDSSSTGDEFTMKLYKYNSKQQPQQQQSNSNVIGNVESILNSSSDADIIDRVDELSVRCIRALYSSEAEWKSFANTDRFLETMLYKPLSVDTENQVRMCIKAISRHELLSKPTTLEQDEGLLQTIQQVSEDNSVSNSSNGFSTRATKQRAPSNKNAVSYDEMLPLMFRIEKKRILKSFQ